MSIVIREELCPKNHRCPAVRECPVQALTQTGFSAPVINTEKCIDCGKCAEICPMGAIKSE